MSLRKKTLYVAESHAGWVVKHPDGQEQSGPHSDRENAIASALMIAKETRAQQVKVCHSVGLWSVEYTYWREAASELNR
jgi:hypothetical protein